MPSGHEALYYQKKANKRVQCGLCPHFCHLKPGEVGKCMGRENIEGKLIATNYSELCTIAIDPIEKKPLYHFYPGSQIVSTGPNGCNLSCDFCQNWEISQEKIQTRHVSPEELVDETLKHDGIGISYTYTEPLIWYEYVLDCSTLAWEKGLVNVLVSNGTINPEPFEKLLPLIDGINIDLKSVNPEFYREICGGFLEPVLEIIKMAAAATHVEITNLLITDLNDSEGEIEKLVDFLAGISDEIPLHFSRYSPRYHRDNIPTPMERLRMAHRIASSKLKYVYLGNVADEEASSTKCPQCGAVLITRSWMSVAVEKLEGSKCADCGADINIVV